jgi:serine/threonine protein kinase
MTISGGALTGQWLGDYQLQGVLGVGGMAEVYRARAPVLDREVAVKVLPAALAADSVYVRRFREEARWVAALHHPHIVPVYHYGEDAGLLYLVMPIYRESLRDRLQHADTRHQERLDPEEAIQLVSEIASALEAAHAQGLVHRDVKPENILLDEAGRALLTDFGIARSVSHTQEGRRETIGSTGLPVGTPEYMAPEQLRNDPVDQRADIYALGAVLYEALTGQPPHEAATPYEVATLALTAPLILPAVHNPQIWPALEQVILTALARRPEDRFQDVASFAAALQASLGARDWLDSAHTSTTPRQSLASAVGSDSDGRPAMLEEVANDQAPTLPDIPVAQLPALARARAALRRPRTVLMTAVTALLVVTLALTAAFALGNGGARTIVLPGAVVTATPPPGASATVMTLETPSAQATTQTTPPATAAPNPTPTSAPLPALTITPTPLALNPLPTNTHTCSATQTITNNTAQTLGWTWEKPTLGGFHFQVNNGPQLDCKTPPVAYAILMTDTLGNQYPFALQLQ